MLDCTLFMSTVRTESSPTSATAVKEKSNEWWRNEKLRMASIDTSTQNTTTNEKKERNKDNSEPFLSKWAQSAIGQELQLNLKTSFSKDCS